ncbi:hypothetical protein HI914_06794 [Erysiphe necator]|nr:hypothetical protein HI914_06794 [Erysiphe necator]
MTSFTDFPNVDCDQAKRRTKLTGSSNHKYRPRHAQAIDPSLVFCPPGLSEVTKSHLPRSETQSTTPLKKSKKGLRKQLAVYEVHD